MFYREGMFTYPLSLRITYFDARCFIEIIRGKCIIEYLMDFFKN